MEIKGKYQISNSREAVWAALNDPEILKQSIPGCESLDRESETEFSAKITMAIGPVKARFNTHLSLENLNPPESYTIVGESKAGAAGFGRGKANVTLTPQDGGTLLSYEADFTVGGKLAQVGSRLVIGAMRKIANEFFSAFSATLDPAAVRLDDDTAAAAPENSRAWLAASGFLIMLLIWWFLLR